MTPLLGIGDRFGRRWSAFWFTPRPASTLTVMRAAIGATSAAWALSILPDLQTFYFDDGLLREPAYASYRLGLFQWFTSDAAVVVVWATMVLCSLAVMFGRLVRLTAPILWLATVTMQQGAPSALNAGDLLLRIWATYLALFALLTPAVHLSHSLFRAPAAGGERWPPAPSWLLRVAQIQLTVIYPATVIAKLEGDTWREGTAALYALGLRDFERFWVPHYLRENLILGNAMTWFTLGVELALPFLLWTRRTRWLGIVLGVAMHVGFDYVMRLGFFLPALGIGYLSFVHPHEVDRALTWLRNRVRRARAVAAGVPHEPAHARS